MARCWKTTKIKCFLTTLVLLSSGVNFASAHTVPADDVQTSSEKDEYEIRIKNENNTEVITLVNPKPDKEMLREYIFVRILERPYAVSEMSKENITKYSEPGNEILPEETTEGVSPHEELKEMIPSLKEDLEVDSSPHDFTNGHGFQYFYGHSGDEDNEIVQPRPLTKTDLKYAEIGKVGAVNNSTSNDDVIPSEPPNAERNQLKEEEGSLNKTIEDIPEKSIAESNENIQSSTSPTTNVIEDATPETDDKTPAEQLQLNFEDSFSMAPSGQEPLVKRNYNDEYFTSTTQYPLIDQNQNINSFRPTMTIDVRNGFEMLNSGVDTSVQNPNLILTQPIITPKINVPQPTVKTPIGITQPFTDATRQSIVQNTVMPLNMHGDKIIIPETSGSVLLNKGNTIVAQLPPFELSATIPLSHFKIGSLLTGRDQFKDLVAQVNKQATNAALTQVGKDSIGSVTIVTHVTKDMNTTDVTIKATAAIHVTNSEDVVNNEESFKPVEMTATIPKLLLQENGAWKTEADQFKDVVARVNEQATETVLSRIDKDSSTSVTVVTQVTKELNASDVTIKASSAVDVTNEKEFIIPNKESSDYTKTEEPRQVADRKANFENHARVARNLLFNKMKERYLKMYSPMSSDDTSTSGRRKRSTKSTHKTKRRLRGRHLRRLSNDKMKNEIDHRVEQIFSKLKDENKLSLTETDNADCAEGELSNHNDKLTPNAELFEEPIENVIYALSNTQSQNTYGMTLTEGQGHVWNNLLKPKLYYEIATPHVAPQIENNKLENVDSSNQNIPGTPVIQEEEGDIHKGANIPSKIHESHVRPCDHDKLETQTEIAHGNKFEINNDLDDIYVNIHKGNSHTNIKPDIKPTQGTVSGESDKDLSIHHGVFYEVGLPQTLRKTNFLSSSRRKRDLTNIPEPPTLPELDISQLPKNIRALISTERPSNKSEESEKKNFENQVEYDSSEEEEDSESEYDSGEVSDIENDDNGDQVTEYKNEDDSTSTMDTNSEIDNVKLMMNPRTYGMSLDSGQGYVWNNLVNDPAKVYRIGDLSLDDSNSNNEGDGEPTNGLHETENPEPNRDTSDDSQTYDTSNPSNIPNSDDNVKDEPELHNKENDDKYEDPNVKPNSDEGDKELEIDETNKTVDNEPESSEQPTQHEENEDNKDVTSEPNEEVNENKPENTETKDNENPTKEDTTTTENNNVSDAISTTCKHSNDTNSAVRPINIEELVKNDLFWKWLNDWTTSYLDKMEKHVKELVAAEVIKQLKSKPAVDPINKFNDSKPKTKSKKKNDKDNKKVQMEAHNIFGKSVGDGDVTNIFLFYGGNDTDKIITNFKPLITSQIKDKDKDNNEPMVPTHNEENNNLDNLGKKLVTLNEEVLNSSAETNSSGTTESNPKSLTPTEHTSTVHKENKINAKPSTKTTEIDKDTVNNQRPLNTKEYESQHNKSSTTTPSTGQYGNHEKSIKKNEKDKVKHNEKHTHDTNINKTTAVSENNKSYDKEGKPDKIEKLVTLSHDEKFSKNSEKISNENDKNEEAPKDSQTAISTTINLNDKEKPNNENKDYKKDNKEHLGKITDTEAKPLNNIDKDDQGSSVTSHQKDKDSEPENQKDQNEKEIKPTKETNDDESKKEENIEKTSNKTEEPLLPKLDNRTKEIENEETNKEENEDNTKSVKPEKENTQETKENSDSKDDIKPDIQNKEDKTSSTTENTTTQKEADSVIFATTETPEEEKKD